MPDLMLFEAKDQLSFCTRNGLCLSVLISKERYNVCQFCHEEFERAEILAIHVLQKHSDEIEDQD